MTRLIEHRAIFAIQNLIGIVRTRVGDVNLSAQEVDKINYARTILMQLYTNDCDATIQPLVKDE